MARLTMTEQLAAVQSQLEVAKQEIYNLQASLRTVTAELSAQKVDYEKKLKDKDASYSYQSSNLTSAQNEIEQAHAVLDGVEGAPSRDYEREGGYGKTQRNVVTRLAGAFLAIAKSGGVK